MLFFHLGFSLFSLCLPSSWPFSKLNSSRISSEKVSPAAPHQGELSHAETLEDLQPGHPRDLSFSTHKWSSGLPCLCICFPETWNLFLSLLSLASVQFKAMFRYHLLFKVWKKMPSSAVRHSLSLVPKASFAFLHYSKYPIVMELLVFSKRQWEN